MLYPMLNILYFYISTYRTCVQCPMWLFSVVQYLDFVLSRFVAQVFSEWFWEDSSCPYFYWYHFCFYVPRSLYLCCKVFIFWNLFGFLLLILLHYYYYYYYYYHHHPVKEYEKDRTCSMRGRFETYITILVCNPRGETISDIVT
jgi:hypothetical protein